MDWESVALTVISIVFIIILLSEVTWSSPTYTDYDNTQYEYDTVVAQCVPISSDNQTRCNTGYFISTSIGNNACMPCEYSKVGTTGQCDGLGTEYKTVKMRTQYTMYVRNNINTPNSTDGLYSIESDIITQQGTSYTINNIHVIDITCPTIVNDTYRPHNYSIMVKDFDIMNHISAYQNVMCLLNPNPYHGTATLVLGLNSYVPTDTLIVIEEIDPSVDLAYTMSFKLGDPSGVIVYNSTGTRNDGIKMQYSNDTHILSLMYPNLNASPIAFIRAIESVVDVNVLQRDNTFAYACEVNSELTFQALISNSCIPINVNINYLKEHAAI